MRVRRYKTASFRDYFLGARAVLDILFKFAPGMESGRKNEGFISDLLMQFDGQPLDGQILDQNQERQPLEEIQGVGQHWQR
mgnify:CR=1 FL=1